MIRLLLLLIALLPQYAFAEDIKFAPHAGDLSVSYLATIFGVVDGVLHGTGSQIIGTMFGVFNSIVLTMGLTILTYTFIVSTINTAHEGEMMGKKWSSIWIPLRVSTGVALLLPKASGYSFLQIMVMWIVVQGAGAADKVWNVALDYLQRGGVIVQPMQALNQTGQMASQTGGMSLVTGNNVRLVLKAGDILKSQVCMSLLNDIYNSYARDNSGDSLSSSNFAANLKVTGNTQNPVTDYGKVDYSRDTGGIMYFPGPVMVKGYNLMGFCGSVSWSFIPAEQRQYISNPAKLSAFDSRSLAVQQMVYDTQPMAQSIATQLKTQSNPSLDAYNNQLMYTAADYLGIIMPALRNSAQNPVIGSVMNGLRSNIISEAKAVGWMLAGSYYYKLITINSLNYAAGGTVAENPDLITYTSQIPEAQSSLQCNNSSNTLQNCKDKVGNILNSSAINSLNLGLFKTGNPCANRTFFLDNYICDEFGRANSSTPGSSMLNPSLPAITAGSFNTGNEKGDKIVSTWAWEFGDMMQKLRNVQSQPGDPIIIIAKLGVTLISGIEKIWTIMVGVFAGLFVLSGIVGLFSAGTASVMGMGIGAVASWFMTVIAVFSVPMFVAGAIMAYYIPVIPFILFLFGVLTWFMMVFEAMMAAPLVALGLAHPEGHEHLGKAEYAVMLLAGVFLRPMLMIFGFIAAIIFSHIALWMVNAGFGNAWSYVNENQFQDWWGIAYGAASISIYTVIVLTVVNRSFSLIYEVPNKVLRWVGGATEQTGEGHALEEIKGKFNRDMEVAGSTGSKATEASVESGKQIGQTMTKAKQEIDSKKGGGVSV